MGKRSKTKGVFGKKCGQTFRVDVAKSLQKKPVILATKDSGWMDGWFGCFGDWEGRNYVWKTFIGRGRKKQLVVGEGSQQNNLQMAKLWVCGINYIFQFKKAKIKTTKTTSPLLSGLKTLDSFWKFCVITSSVGVRVATFLGRSINFPGKKVKFDHFLFFVLGGCQSCRRRHFDGRQLIRISSENFPGSFSVAQTWLTLTLTISLSCFVFPVLLYFILRVRT